MLEVVTNIKIPEKFKAVEGGKERYDMCKAFEDLRLEGYEAGISAGIAEGIEKLIKTVRDLGASKSAACGQLSQKYALNENESNEKKGMYR